jgi:hypothetical protein
MKKVIVFFLVAFSNFYSVQAEVPFGEFWGILTKSPRPEFSLLWGEVLLKSDVLKRIRFFGNYTSIPNPSYPPLLKNTEFNCPQDPISALVEYLFPSPDGAILSHNDRLNDPLGEIATKKRFDILNGLLEIAIKVSEKTLSRENTNASLKNLFESFSRELERQEKLKAHKIETTARILTDALFYEDPHNLYPPHMAVYALLAFACKMGDTIQELGPLSSVLYPSKRTLPRFTKETYDKGLPSFLTKLKGGKASAEDIFLYKQGYISYYRRVPDLLVFQKTKFHPKGGDVPIEYSDCGETSLRNLFYILLGTGGYVLPSALDHLETALHSHKNPHLEGTYREFIDFMKKYPDISMARNTTAREEWSHLVSGLNEKASAAGNKITYREGNVCNLPGAGGIINMLSVIEKLVPDKGLGAPWRGNMPEDLSIASEKLNRFCTLFSRENFALTWDCNGQQTIPANTDINISFFINGIPAFIWKITMIHFEIFPLDEPQGDFSFLGSFDKVPKTDWRHRKDVSSAIAERFSEYGPLIKTLLINVPLIAQLAGQESEIFPYYLWGLNLEKLPTNIQTINFAIQRDWQSFWPLPQILIGKNFVNLDDAETAHEFTSVLNNYLNPFLGHLIENLSLRSKANLLIAACQSSNINDEGTREAILGFLLRAGANVDGDPSTEETPLVAYLERRRANLSIIQLLLNHGANPNKPGRRNFTPLMEAIRGNSLEATKLLHTHGATINNVKNSDGETSLVIAIQTKNLPIINYLIQHGADIAFQGLAMQAATNVYVPDKDLIAYLKSESKKQVEQRLL